jgi:hypothetical protein
MQQDSFSPYLSHSSSGTYEDVPAQADAPTSPKTDNDVDTIGQGSAICTPHSSPGVAKTGSFAEIFRVLDAPHLTDLPVPQFLAGYNPTPTKYEYPERPSLAKMFGFTAVTKDRWAGKDWTGQALGSWVVQCRDEERRSHWIAKCSGCKERISLHRKQVAHKAKFRCTTCEPWPESQIRRFAGLHHANFIRLPKEET